MTTKPEVKLVGQDGNAFAIIGACREAAKKAGWTDVSRLLFDWCVLYLMVGNEPCPFSYGIPKLFDLSFDAFPCNAAIDDYLGIEGNSLLFRI